MKKSIYAALAIWILFLNGIFLAWAVVKSPGADLTKALENIWYNTIDANNYVEIAEHWYYLVEGSELQYKIAFFPLYAVLMRAVKTVVGTYPAAGMLLSSACAFAGGVLVHRLAKRELGEKAAGKAVRFLFLMPAAFFFVVPMTESLFLLLTAAFFCCLLEGRYALAGLCGFLAALTRSQGMLLAAPFALELILVTVKMKGKGRFAWLMKNGLFALGPVLGICAYFAINLHVYGNPFYFMEIQSRHWGNSLTGFWNTPVYLVKYLAGYLKDGRVWLAAGLSVPNLTAFFLGLLLIVAGAKRLRPSITLYSLAYFAMSFGVTWLLSGPRYLSCLFPIALTAADKAEKYKFFNVFFTLMYGIMFAAYLYLFINRKYVY